MGHTARRRRPRYSWGTGTGWRSDCLGQRTKPADSAMLCRRRRQRPLEELDGIGTVPRCMGVMRASCVPFDGDPGLYCCCCCCCHHNQLQQQQQQQGGGSPLKGSHDALVTINFISRLRRWKVHSLIATINLTGAENSRPVRRFAFYPPHPPTRVQLIIVYWCISRTSDVAGILAEVTRP